MSPIIESLMRTNNTIILAIKFLILISLIIPFTFLPIALANHFNQTTTTQPRNRARHHSMKNSPQHSSTKAKRLQYSSRRRLTPIRPPPPTKALKFPPPQSLYTTQHASFTTTHPLTRQRQQRQTITTTTTSKRHWGWPKDAKHAIDWPKTQVPSVFAGWTPPAYSKDNVFLRIGRGDVEIGVIELKLFDSIVPKTAHNFRQLAMGSKKVQDMPLHYKGTRFYRVIKNFCIQGGDITNDNGHGGASIYGRHFPDESFLVKHDRPFLLGSANRGPNTNNSGFYITTVPAPWLDGRSVVFGEVVYGHDVVRDIEYSETNPMDGPVQPVFIVDCGIVNTKTQLNKALRSW